MTVDRTRLHDFIYGHESESPSEKRKEGSSFFDGTGLPAPGKNQKVYPSVTLKHTRIKEELHEGNGKRYVTDDGVHMKALLNFPRQQEGTQHRRRQRYILQRVTGDDVLQIIREHDMDGYLELPASQHDNDKSIVESANFYLKFPYHQGIMAGRLDNIAPISRKTDGPCYFSAVCCKAYVNYGTWDGMIQRSVPINTSNSKTTSSTGLHFAEAGDEHASTKKPFYIDKIHSMEVIEDQPDERDHYDASKHYLFPEGYRPLAKGCLNFTLFLKRYDNDHGDENQKEEDAHATLCLMFRPETKEEERKRATSNSKSMLPNEILEEINKLPPSRHTSHRK